MAAIGSVLNRAISTSISAADVAADLAFLAFNIDTAGGATVLIDGFDFHMNVVGADYNNLNFVQVFIMRNITMSANIGRGAQLAQGVEFYAAFATKNISDRVIERQFIQPVILEPGAKYAILANPSFAAYVGPAFLEGNVWGRTVQKSGQEFPFDLR